MRVYAGGMIPLRPAALVFIALLLAACATTRAPRTVLPVAAQEDLLRQLPHFVAEGRVAVKAADKGPIASLHWDQRGEGARVRLSGPFGSGSLTVDFSPSSLRLTSGGDVFEGAEAEALLVREIGLVPPFESMRHWLLGMEAPGEPATQRTPSPDGRIGELAQQDWHIRYQEWMNVAADGGGVQLPRLLHITRDDLRLRVIIRRWTL